MIGIVGDSNSGKSTLLNALIGQKLLPQSYKSCTSTVTLAALRDVDTPTLTFMRAGELETIEGKKDIHNRIKSLNEETRGFGALAEVTTLSLVSKGRRELVDAGICDGQVTLADMPGQDESDNPVVKQCLHELLSRCHGLFIIVKHDAIKSDRLAVLVDKLASQAPHLFRTPGAVNFVISQADTLRFDDDANSDDDSGADDEAAAAVAQAQTGAKVVKDLKREMKKFLCNRDCLLQFPSFLADVQVVATSVDSKLTGGFEFGKMCEIIGALHKTCKELRLARKVAFSQEVYVQFCDLLLATRPRYPARAEQVKKALADKKTLDRTLAAVSAISFAVTIPLGGWGLAVGSAIRLGAAGAALATGAAGQYARKHADSMVQSNGGGAHMMLRGEDMAVSAEELGAIGAEEANQRVTFSLDVQDIDEGAPYEDTLLIEDGSPLYVGGFLKNLPEGKGRLFWPSTNYECFIGDFVEGLPKEGLFFNERGFLLGRMRANARGDLEAVDTAEEADTSADAEESW